MNGRGGEARTPNTRFWRPVLYQLNYAPIGMNKLAEWTGLEPATPCVTGRYSNQLNYHTVLGRLPFDGAKIHISHHTTKRLVVSQGFEP